MPLVVAQQDIRPEEIKRIAVRDGLGVLNTKFFRASEASPDSPTAFLAKHDPARYTNAHYHIVDQFQIVVGGKGKFGRHEVTPCCVHFSRAYTPYGPLIPDEESGFSFITLRVRYDPGHEDVPQSRHKLLQVPDRHPWQISTQVTFPAITSGFSMQEIAGIKDDQGLFAHTLTMAPGAQLSAPDPSGGDGQFIVVLKGSLMHESRELKAVTVAFLRPEEQALKLQSGDQGLEGLILNFPQVKPRTVEVKQAPVAGSFKKLQCLLCSFAYDEALGMPEEGIPPGTRWQDVPETWSCPDCAASKSDFEMVEI